MFDDTGIYKELKSRRDGKSKYYITFVNQIESNLEPISKQIRKEYPEYSGFNTDHTEKILQHISMLMNDDFKKGLSSLEIVVLIFASLFHDAGSYLFNSNQTNKRKLQQEHIQASKFVVDYYFDNAVGKMDGKERIKRAIEFVCEANDYSLDVIINKEELFITDRIETFKVHYDLLAFLLRIGDLLDFEAEQTKNSKMMLFSSTYSKYSFDKIERENSIKNTDYDPEKIVINVYAENKSQYKIWSDWYSFLQAEIEKFNTLFACRGFILPNPSINIKRPDLAKYDVETLRFEIDDSGGMWEVISKSVYTNELDFLRELIQNAIDATLKCVYSNNSIKLVYPSPRSWNVNGSDIVIVYSEKTRVLSVTDYGVGMNVDDLKNYLFKVSGSGTVNTGTRKFPFPGIAKYGIGFISCLINAEEISIYTSDNESDLHVVSLESNSNIAFIENTENRNSYKGTTIVLKLKNSFLFSEIKDYLCKTVRYPSVGMCLYDLDYINSVLPKINNVDIYAVFQKEPYSFEKYLQVESTEIERILDPIYELKSMTNKSLGLLDELKGIYNAKGTELINIKDVKLNQSYNSRVNDLQKSMKELGISGFFDEIRIPNDQIKGKNLWSQIKMIGTAFNNNEMLLKSRLNDINDEIIRYAINKSSITNSGFCSFGDWKYYFVDIDSLLEPRTVEKSRDRISLDGRQGLLFINQEIHNYALGIECSAVHAFLVSSGTIFNRLVRLKAIVQDKESCECKRVTVTVPVLGWKFGIEDEIIENRDAKCALNKYYIDPDCLFDSEYEDLFVTRDGVSTPAIRSIDENDYEVNCAYSYPEEQDIEKYIPDELKHILEEDAGVFFQDGIAIPSEIDSIFPMGFFRVYCNLTAGSRMKLNITRHNTSEIRTDIDEWFSKTGGYIQKELFKGLTNSFCELGIKVKDYRVLLWPEYNDSPFEKMALKSFLEVLMNSSFE